ncbi:MAG: ATP-dependent zinc metalloprotease FtsH [Patescibacteria group bacterium]|jgi:cell division protease FtsH
MKNNNQSKNAFYFIIILLLALGVYSFFSSPSKAPKDVALSEISQDVKEDKVKSIQVNQDKIIATLKDGNKIQSYKESGVGLSEYGITSDKVAINVSNPDKSNWVVLLLTGVLPIVLIIGFFYFMMRQAQGGNSKAMSFGKSTARLTGPSKKTTFNDVAGLEEAKQELSEIVDFLKKPEKYKKLGAEIPKGVLLFGPPGVGKTLLAKAVAGEAGVPFFSISASEFVEMFVGVGASRVRDLFQKAKRNAPCVIFIDELDAVGRQRGTGLGGSHDEREQTLNQILVEMDGFETDDRVIVLAATNRPDVLDKALLRPGRFDRRVTLDLPDRKDREQILAIYAKNKPLDKKINLNTVAGRTIGFSGADLRNVLNESAILAARDNSNTVSQLHLNEAVEKVIMGPEKKSQILSDQEKQIAAFHEGGHAIIGALLPYCNPVHKVSVVSRGMALGYTMSLPNEDTHLKSKSEFIDDITQLLGGRAAEELIFDEQTTGAQNDLKVATKIAKEMVMVYGMSEVGPISLGEREEVVFLGRELGERQHFSEQKGAEIDKAISGIIFNAEDRAKKILKEHKKELEKISEVLVKEESLEGERLDNLLPKKQEIKIIKKA